jgi:hypothetical protein
LNDDAQVMMGGTGKTPASIGEEISRL